MAPHTDVQTGKPTLEEALKIIRESHCICFDVDSTVVREEGIDVLAESVGAGEAVAAWTAKAMGGDTTFQEALAARLELMKPSHQQVQACLDATPLQFSPGIPEIIKYFQEEGKDVHLVSGGFRQMINPLAEVLNIPKGNVHANNLLFNEDGSYKGFDESEPTSRSGGKPKALQSIIDSKGHSVVIMVGDGATDMEARPPAKLFIGYGGNQVREKVKAGADLWCTDFEALLKDLQRTA
eukprot:Clim_evm11s66 gene=Clim_evmTU11s66